LEELSAENEGRLVRTQIEQQKRLVSEAEGRLQEAFQALQKQSLWSLRLLSKMHGRALKQLRQEHQREMESEADEAEKARHGLEQKLQQIGREGEAAPQAVVIGYDRSSQRAMAPRIIARLRSVKHRVRTMTD
jgi:hypothetical protein